MAIKPNGYWYRKVEVTGVTESKHVKTAEIVITDNKMLAEMRSEVCSEMHIG